MRFFITIISVSIITLFLSSCGWKVETESVSISSDYHKNGNPLRLAVFPLTCPAKNGIPAIHIERFLSRELIRHGALPVIQDDVYHILSHYNVIERQGQKGRKNFYDRYALSGWSDDMKSEVAKAIYADRHYDAPSNNYIYTDRGCNNIKYISSPLLKKIGRELGVNYIIRGNVDAFYTQKAYSLSPIQRGLMPSFFDISSKILWGNSRDSRYNMLHSAIMGGITGSIIGGSLEHPFTPPSSKNSIINKGNPLMEYSVSEKEGGYENYSSLNSLTWALAGMGAGAVASSTGGEELLETKIIIELSLQSAITAQVLWKASATAIVQPVSVFSDNRIIVQQERAIEEAVRALVNELVYYLYDLKGIKPQKVAFSKL